MKTKKESLKEKLKYIEEEIRSYEEAKQKIEQEIYKKKYLDNIEYPKLNWIEKNNKLETIARVLAKVWYYGNFKAETPNERVLEMLMEDLGLYEFVREDDMIAATQIDENLYKQARDRAEKPKITTLVSEWNQWKEDRSNEGQQFVSFESFLSYIDNKYLVVQDCDRD